MQTETETRIGKDLVAASAMPLVLAILNEGETYGYAILKRIQELSGGAMEWTDGMLYPLLHRLDRLGFVEARWDSPENGRKRRYYRITPAGGDALQEQRRQWDVVAGTLRNAWHSLKAACRPLTRAVA
ncbi:MAG: helix-turn-helix transcriptional regulator [Dehalococcoidia bacterium]